MKLISKIYEEIKLKERINIPVNVQMNKKYQKSIKSLISSIETYNNTKEYFEFFTIEVKKIK